MRALAGGAWRDGYLDPHRGADDVRIEVFGWAAVAPVSELYFAPDRDLRLIGAYLRAIGPRAVLRKVRSRQSERHRNEKWLAYGVGRLLEGELADGAARGAPVAFLAPKHPECVDRVVVPRELAVSVAEEAVASLVPGEVRHLGPGDSVRDEGWSDLSGWDPESGEPLTPASVAGWLDGLENAVQGTSWDSGRSLPAGRDQPVAERSEPGRPASESQRLALFGYGNYAKTTILPHLCKQLPLACVHELDPLQVPHPLPPDVAWDTAPEPRPDERYDVYAIAGYHHTHAPLAVEALARGADAVVEKPLAVTHDQLDSLVEAAGSSDARVYACFNRRFIPANDWVLEDLCPGGRRPISYHCVVFEVPLPAQHWYRWPRSGSRMLSNGCHWLDHFLFLNEFAAPVRHSVSVVDERTVSCEVRLENGAVFTMVLTDRGSARIGVREHIELRVEGASATIVDSSRYVAEDDRRVLRRRRFSPLTGYRSMYTSIGDSITSGAPGDSVTAIERSGRLALDLDAALTDSGARALVRPRL